LVEWAGREAADSVKVVLANGGVLSGRIAATAPLEVANSGGASLVEAAANRALGPPGGARIRRLAAARAIRAIGDFDLVYLNAITGPGTELLAAVDPAIPVVTHVHELGIGFDQTTSPEGLRLVAERTHRFIAVSKVVGELIAERFERELETIPIAAALLSDHQPVPSPESRQRARRRMGVAENAFVVGACGVRDWRKAPDLFLRLAWEVSRTETVVPVEFRWLGGQSPDDWQLEHEALALGVQSQVAFIDEVENPSELFVGFDAMAITAREDAYPLAALEAAASGVPLLSFDTGGIVQFINDSRDGPGPGPVGEVFRRGDVATMARTIVELAADASRAAEWGAAACARVGELHPPGRAAADLWSLITRPTRE